MARPNQRTLATLVLGLLASANAFALSISSPVPTIPTTTLPLPKAPVCYTLQVSSAGGGVLTGRYYERRCAEGEKEGSVKFVTA